MLSRFPVAELAWMAISPLAGIGLVAGLALLLRRLVLPARVTQYLARVATVSSVAAGLFLGQRGQLGAHGPAGPLSVGVPAGRGR